MQMNHGIAMRIPPPNPPSRSPGDLNPMHPPILIPMPKRRHNDQSLPQRGNRLLIGIMQTLIEQIGNPRCPIQIDGGVVKQIERHDGASSA
jgi:hypothetical protein